MSNEKYDLNLIHISTEDLIKEIESRCSEFVCAYNPNGFQTKRESMFHYGNGSWHRACALSNVLNNDVLNNWNNELRTLQRLNEDI